MNQQERESGVEKEGEKEEGIFSKGIPCLHQKLLKSTLLTSERITF